MGHRCSGLTAMGKGGRYKLGARKGMVEVRLRAGPARALREENAMLKENAQRLEAERRKLLDENKQVRAEAEALRASLCKSQELYKSLQAELRAETNRRLSYEFDFLPTRQRRIMQELRG